jgi:hypothetical protein
MRSIQHHKSLSTKGREKRWICNVFPVKYELNFYMFKCAASNITSPCLQKEGKKDEDVMCFLWSTNWIFICSNAQHPASQVLVYKRKGKSMCKEPYTDLFELQLTGLTADKEKSCCASNILTSTGIGQLPLTSESARISVSCELLSADS